MVPTAEAPHPQTNLHGQPLPEEILEAPDAAAASFYINSDGNVMAVDVNISGVFRAGIPKPLFKPPAGVRMLYGSIKTG